MEQVEGGKNLWGGTRSSKWDSFRERVLGTVLLKLEKRRFGVRADRYPGKKAKARIA